MTPSEPSTPLEKSVARPFDPIAWLKILRATFERGKGGIHTTWLGDADMEAFDLAITALEASPSPGVPDGWRLVPVEPTEAMLGAAWDGTVDWRRLVEKADDHEVAALYRAMIAAAPLPTPPEGT